jgi:hypothetical protein
MAGLMAAQIMRRHQPFVFEAQMKLPDNHGALLRFRSDAVEKATGIRLKRVEVRKAVMVDGHLRDWATIADGNRYSLKVSGQATDRSILNLGGGERYIAPDNFIAQLGEGVSVQYETPLTSEMIEARNPESDPIISTIPMPMLAELVKWEGTDSKDFKYNSIWSVRAELLIPTVDLYQTIYFPEWQQCYRASITGRQLIIEYAEEPSKYLDEQVQEVVRSFGIYVRESVQCWTSPELKHQKYGKLLPMDEGARRSFILAMSDRYNIYSLGRFATWRQILLDDVVHDVSIIRNFIRERSAFSRQRHWM